MDLTQLEYLSTFATVGTLTGAAEELHVTQPALSRSMKNLEEELGISLFNRGKNRIELNDNGRYAADLAQAVLKSALDMKKRLKDFDKSNRTITVGSCAPAPLWTLLSKIALLLPEMAIASDTGNIGDILDGFNEDRYRLIVMPYPSGDVGIVSAKYMEENLLFSLPKDHRYAKRKALSFSELNGENFLVNSRIGFWHDIHFKNMPDSKFIIMNGEEMQIISQSSKLPRFNTDASINQFGAEKGRVTIPIKDKDAHQSFYLWCKKGDNYNMLRSLF